MKTMQRSEASADVSEFNLTEVGKEKVKLNELIKSLKKSSRHTILKKQLEKASKKKQLPVPLSKPQSERIKRTVAYGKVSSEVGKWDSIVQSNRLAEQIVYPLKPPEFRLDTTEEVSKRFQTKNALEEEVSRLLNGSDNVLDQKKTLTVAEERALKAMSLAEAKARHEELRKMRALLSFKEAKARRLKKIKSKKYHRILKRDKMKKLMKEFEELQKTNPDAAKEKLVETDKLRILERMTLKHRSTGKWAKQQKLRAKYNVESRNALKEQVNLSRQLTEKVIPNNDSEKASHVGSSSNKLDHFNVEDASVAEEPEDVELLNMYRLDFNIEEEKMAEVNALNAKRKKLLESRRAKKSVERKVPTVEKADILSDEQNNLVDETMKRFRTVDDFEAMGEHDVLNAVTNTSNLSSDVNLDKKSDSQNVKTPTNYVVESGFSTEVKFLDSMVPDDIAYGDEGIDDVEEDRMDIRQAFADEDFIAEFREDKKAVEKKERPQGIDLFLPGWGTWGGTGIKPSRRKRRRFYVKPVDQVRKDSTLGNVIINEEKDKKAAIHQVSDLPFPYKNVEQFHSIIRQPVGNTWNPEKSYQKLIAPQVITKMGKIIEPMDANDVVFKKTSEPGLKRKKKSLHGKQDGKTKKGKWKSKAKKEKSTVT